MRRNQVTVVPEDSLIIVDGTPIRVAFRCREGVRVIQWYNGSGHIEWVDDLNHLLSVDDTTAYTDEVAPYVAIWLAEKERLEQEATARAAEEAAAEAARLAEYNSVPARTERLRLNRDGKLDGTDKYLVADYPISPEDLLVVKVYRQALRDLPAQPGAPWTDDTIPWPTLTIGGNNGS